ncbi:hypothetical protein [Pseudoglutamicibacter cumminsii]|uniref:hypothetical protein n=1 Tax=Pseudoglutamicibacter cumminsii TaxID=156979 RepID=UPI00195EB037|nr:hypothetical protein [Pseudoglutamicibacter cumminsii]MBM7796969.1 hypothetical protein [Pseudoglutamicibacter cumminsii]
MIATNNAQESERQTVWRVTVAWPETDPVGQQERVDGLMQILTHRKIVGLMGPGRPTRRGVAVELVLPMRETRVLTATFEGDVEPGLGGEEFARELHASTGAVIVNGDPASGDFAVLAASEDFGDRQIAGVLEERITSVLLLDTVRPSAVEDALDRSEVSGWMAEGERTVVALNSVPADPTMLIMPGSDKISCSIRERAGRVDVALWGPAESRQQPVTRRRRAAQFTPLINTHAGARCRPIVLPEMYRPAGSQVASLLLRLEEDFAPLSENDIKTLASMLPPKRVDALVSAINDAPVRGVDPEAGALAVLEDGLMPGEEVEDTSDQEQEQAYAATRAMLEALGEDTAWIGLFEGRSPVGGSVRPVGVPGHDQFETDAAETEATEPDAAVEQEAVDYAADVPVADDGLVPVSEAGAASAEAQPEHDEPGEIEASQGGFESQLADATSSKSEPSFSEILGLQSGANDPAVVQPGSDYPQPTPAGQTTVATETELGTAPRRVAHIVWLVVGIVGLIVGAFLVLRGMDVISFPEVAFQARSTLAVIGGIVALVGGACMLLAASMWPRQRK